MRGFLVVALVVPLLVLGCGGNQTSAPSSMVGTAAAATPSGPRSPATSKAAPAARSNFATAAAAICKRMQRQTETISSGKQPSDAEVAELVDTWRARVDQLDALEPTPGRRRQFEKMLVHYRNMARAFDAMTEAEDETVLAAVVGGVVEGQRGSRAARKAGLDACALFPEIRQPPADREPLYDATRDLVPARARIVRGDALECDTSDSCRIEYEFDRNVTDRIREARALLRTRGWTNIRSGRTPTGGWWLMANRNDYEVTLEFVGDKLPEHCGGPVTYGCSNDVWVKRVEVPDVLLGG